jgi:hypothetical protein
MDRGSGREETYVSKVIQPPNKIRTAYEDFLERFQIAVEEAAGEVFVPDRPVGSSFTDSGRATVEFKRCLYVRGLPSRRLSRSKRLDVVVMGLEELEKGTGNNKDLWTVRKSTVRLNYIVVSDANGKLAQSLHFDFDQAGQADHPFFHVQLNDERIATAEYPTRDLDFDWQLPTESNECCVTTRIPTSDMTLTSVLYCLAADHLSGDIFKQFALKVDPIQDRLPPLRFEALKNSVEKTSFHFKSSHWFAHMRVATQ